jgi:hypothetical protein
MRTAAGSRRFPDASRGPPKSRRRLSGFIFAQSPNEHLIRVDPRLCFQVVRADWGGHSIVSGAPGAAESGSFATALQDGIALAGTVENWWGWPAGIEASNCLSERTRLNFQSRNVPDPTIGSSCQWN